MPQKTTPMKTFSTLFFSLLSYVMFSQHTVTGIVLDTKKTPLTGANVYVDGTYDGGLTDAQGRFTFTTSATGLQKIVVSLLGYESVDLPYTVGEEQLLQITLKESVNTLDTVVITAGTFDAGERSRVSVLKPLDIVTTAGSNGNIIAALQTLPGTQNVAEDGRLFVRGGEADETQTYIDGIRVAQPYGAAAQNVPTRGRFSPFLFTGMSFSTGGYSAEYGEALSSVLLLNSKEEEVTERTDLSFMTVGLGVANTQVWDKQSLTFNLAYLNLEPYQKLIPQNITWNKPYQSLSGEAVYRYRFTSGLLKVYTAFDYATFDLNQESINTPQPTRVALANTNGYTNISFKGSVGNGWQLTTGASFGHGKNQIDLEQDEVYNQENAAHFKLKLRKSYSDRFKWTMGIDHFITGFKELFSNATLRFSSGYDFPLSAAFTEVDWIFSKKVAAKIGARFAHNGMLKETQLMPRLSLAYKFAKNHQFSWAYGTFAQAPRADYLKYTSALQSERAAHYIMNYLYTHDRQTFRVEVYEKAYQDLIQFNTPTPQFNSDFTNRGSGYARGLDVFWRDGKSIKNLEYWVSYSFIDSQRNYRNFPTTVTPNFIAKHSISLVGKYWINDWKSQLSVTQVLSSGRPYNNPNESLFMNGRTKPFSNLSLSWAYLISSQKILYFSVNNILGTQNVLGYEYANTPDANGVFNRRIIEPTADRFFFVGFFWTLSDNKKDNQLNNL